MTWQLALSNLANIPKDDRYTCKVCGGKFDPYQISRSVYCSVVCKEIGATENKRAAARRAKERKLKPITECKPAQKRNRERGDYWKEVFNAGA